MKYMNPEMEIILLYNCGIITDSLGSLEEETDPGTGTGPGEGVVLPTIQ